MPNGTQMLFEPIRTLAFGGITNLTNQPLYISIDGVNDHIIAPNQAGKVRDICAARTGGDLNGAYIAQNTTFYARTATGANPTSGNVYIEVSYVAGD